MAVGAVNGVNEANIPQKKEQGKGITLTGSLASAGAGAGLGYGAGHLLTRSFVPELKDVLKMTEDEFVKTRSAEYAKSAAAAFKRNNMTSAAPTAEFFAKQAKTNYKVEQVAAKDALNVIKKAKIKWAAVAAAVGLGIYLGSKALFGGKSDKEEAPKTAK